MLSVCYDYRVAACYADVPTLALKTSYRTSDGSLNVVQESCMPEEHANN